MKTNPYNPPPSLESPNGARRRWMTLLLSVLIIGAGVVGAVYVGKSTPKARKRPPEKMSPFVRVLTVQPERHPVVVRAMGTVVPARVMILKSRVAGEVISVAPEFTEGGLIQEGETLVRLDPADFQLALSRKQSAVTDAEYQLKLEMGRQAVAKREWELLDGDRKADALTLDLALRKPHLTKAKADLTAAKADLKQSELDLERTRIRAPFNAIVREKSVEVGSEVAAHGPLAELVGTDAYHVRVSVPTDRLRWMDIPRLDERTGAEARVSFRDGFERSGKVVKLLSDLETEGRMARVLVEVQDPLGRRTTDTGDAVPLLIGEYVRVDIVGPALDGVYRIPRAALRDDARIWVAGKDETLEIREVETVWRDPDTVLVGEGLLPGDRLIVSDLAAPIQGMPVTVEPAQIDPEPDPAPMQPAVSSEKSS